MSVGSQEENDKILPMIIPQGYMTKSIWIGLYFVNLFFLTLNVKEVNQLEVQFKKK